MTNEEKLKICIVPSNEMREVVLILHNGDTQRKVQQRTYDYDGRYYVWRDLKVLHTKDFSEFSKTVMFE